MTVPPIGPARGVSAEVELVERARLVAVTRTWIGTPYHHAARLKGVGVDCATLLAEVWIEAGLLATVEIPAYGFEWHLHRKEEKYREFVERYARLVTSPQPGDVVLYRWGNVNAHGGIVMERGWPQVVHAYSRARIVIEANGRAGDLAAREFSFFSFW